jgi:hypothetical protein
LRWRRFARDELYLQARSSLNKTRLEMSALSRARSLKDAKETGNRTWNAFLRLQVGQGKTRGLPDQTITVVERLYQLHASMIKHLAIMHASRYVQHPRLV